MAGAKGLEVQVRRAADALSRSKALFITAGAGMGVDSGMPDFRGREGFWKEYPPLKHLRIEFSAMSSPRWFRDDPERAWGFFGHRYNLYNSTVPHSGFQILKRWAAQMKNGCFVFTSNVDGHFQKAGFSEDQIEECHGSIHHMQCVGSDSCGIWPVPSNFQIDVDMSVLKAITPLPRGPPDVNDKLARPNILMFSDWEWDSSRTDAQRCRMQEFEEKALEEDFVVVEIGAGLAVPTVRYKSESLVESAPGRGTLIRINPTEPETPPGHIALPMKGLAALQKISTLVGL